MVDYSRQKRLFKEVGSNRISEILVHNIRRLLRSDVDEEVSVHYSMGFEVIDGIRFRRMNE